MSKTRRCGSDASGFTLIETSIALVVILIALLGIAFTITYAISYNTGNNSRAQALAVLQLEVERMRSAKFTPTLTDSVLHGGTTTRTTTLNNLSFRVTTVIDNDPFTAGVQNESVFSSLKEITITAQLANPSPGWQTAIPSTFVLRRVKSN